MYLRRRRRRRRCLSVVISMDCRLHSSPLRTALRHTPFLSNHRLHTQRTLYPGQTGIRDRGQALPASSTLRRTKRTGLQGRTRYGKILPFPSLSFPLSSLFFPFLFFSSPPFSFLSFSCLSFSFLVYPSLSLSVLLPPSLPFLPFPSLSLSFHLRWEYLNAGSVPRDRQRGLVKSFFPGGYFRCLLFPGRLFPGLLIGDADLIISCLCYDRNARDALV